MTEAATTRFRPHWHAVGVIAIGGGAGSLARYALGRGWPVRAGEVPWSTLFINVSGAFLLGLLVVAVTDIWSVHPLVRPGLGTGVLGGWTTFSTFAVESRSLLSGDNSAVGAALVYLALSLLGGIGAASLAMASLRRLEPRLRLAAEHEALDPFDPELP